MYFLSAALAVLSILSEVQALPHPVFSVDQSISLFRKPRARRTFEEQGKHARNRRLALEAKYAIGQFKNQKRASGMNLLINQGADSSFLGSIAVGTPAVSFDVILDTGSSDLWLAGTSSSSETTDVPSDITTFNYADSSTFQSLNEPFEIDYDSGAAQGTLATDTVQMAGFAVASQEFAVVSEVSNGLLDSPASGLMGLAWQQIASSGAMPFWETLATSTGTLTEPLMAFQLTRYSNTSHVQELEPGGTFNIGATNTSLYTGDIDYQDVIEEGYWLQQLSGLTVQGTSISLESGSASYAAIDTGTTLVAGPADVLSELYAQIPGSSAGTGDYENYYVIPCDSNVNVTLSFGNSTRAWAIAATDFIHEQISDSDCLGSFFVTDNAGTSAPAWILGDTFLKNVYSVFRASPASVGFAELSSEALAMNGADSPVPSATIGSVPATVTAAPDSDRAVNGAASHGVGSAVLGMITTGLLVGWLA